MQGIYKIENLINHKVYVGQATDITARWYHHIKALNDNIHHNPHLQSAWNKYGQHSFSFSVIEECDYDNLIEREQFWIDHFGGMESPNTYNLRDANIGGHLSQETREKLSLAGMGKEPWNKGLTKDDPRVANYANTLSSNRLPEEIRRKISSTVTQLHKEGVYDYKEIAKRRAEAMKKNGTVRKDKGTTRGSYSEEHCSNISKGKLAANERKRELGLPLRNDVKKPTPMKTSICIICGAEFQQRQCHYKKTCSKECMSKRISQARKESKNEITGN